MADDLTEARASVDKVKELEEAYDADAQDIKQNLHALKENVEASIAMSSRTLKQSWTRSTTPISKMQKNGKCKMQKRFRR